MTKKTDNHNSAAKLALRRHFLAKYHPAPLHVIDCCAGQGVLWERLKGEFPVARYVGIDKKGGAGLLKMDSVRFLQKPGLSADVVDIDTYGSPWKHWLALLQNFPSSFGLTIFLTIGMVKVAGGNYDRCILSPLGIPFEVPNSIGSALNEVCVSYLLTVCCKSNIFPVEIAEIPNPGGHARYLGVRLERKK